MIGDNLISNEKQSFTIISKGGEKLDFDPDIGEIVYLEEDLENEDPFPEDRWEEEFDNISDEEIS